MPFLKTLMEEISNILKGLNNLVTDLSILGIQNKIESDENLLPAIFFSVILGVLIMLILRFSGKVQKLNAASCILSILLIVSLSS